jgi:hypothetical protein
MKEARSDDLIPLRGRLRIILPTLAVAVAYAGAMVTTNTRIALLDDEAIIVAIAAHPVAHTIKLFLPAVGNTSIRRSPMSSCTVGCC